MFRRVALAAVAGALLSVALLSMGGSARAQMLVQPRPDDEVTLDLKAEGFVETATAKVIVVFDTALEGSGLADARTKLRQILAGFAPQGQWRFTRFDRTVDPAGLERWRVLAESRLAEKELAGLADKAKAASKPGLQVRVQSIDFTPTLAERETTVANLRADIYAQTQAELERLKKAFPDRAYRIKQINFQRDDQGVPMGAMARMVPAPAQAPRSMTPDQAVPDDAVDTLPTVARRLELRASVVLGVVVP